MPDAIFIIPVVIGLVVIVAAMIFGQRVSQKRLEELAALAAELGLSFETAARRGGAPHPAAGFQYFRQGHSRRALNTMTGTLELFGRHCGCCAGDFEYKETSGSGKDRRTTTYRFSYIAFELPWPTPGLTIRRENILDKIAGAVGFDDIDFESEEFSRRYFVKAGDKRFAYDVVHPRMMEFLLATNPPPIVIEGGIEGGACCVTDGMGRWSPVEFRARFEAVRGFCGHWPEHLIADLDSRAAGPGAERR